MEGEMDELEDRRTDTELLIQRSILTGILARIAAARYDMASLGLLVFESEEIEPILEIMGRNDIMASIVKVEAILAALNEDFNEKLEELE